MVQVLVSRETCGPSSRMHHLSCKIYSRQQMYRRLLGHLSSVYCVLFDRTGTYIFTGADDLLVKIWSARDGRLLCTLRGHSAEITDMAVNFENTLLAASSCDKLIRVWCLRTTCPIAVLVGHTAMVTSLQFCPCPKGDTRLLVSTGNDGCVCFWQWSNRTSYFNPKPLKFTERNRAGAQMLCSSFSPGGVFLATGSTDNHVRVYNILGSNGPEKIFELQVHTDRVDSLQFGNAGPRFITGSKDGTAHIWRYERQQWHTMALRMSAKLPGTPINEAEDTKQKFKVTMVGWSLDDAFVVTAVNDHSLKVWNSYTGELKHILNGHDDEVFVLESHPTDYRIFLSGGHDGKIILWDIISGTSIKSFLNLIEGQGHGAVFDCKFSPDGMIFASTDSHGHTSIFGFGSNEHFRKVPEEQFFHTDYRPLIRDANHHVLDEQTQCAPHLMPPPFLVDIDGNPYPPHLQRLVPGRERCNNSQLIPYIAVAANGETEILEPIRPSEGQGDAHRPTIDDMIERLQQEQNHRRGMYFGFGDDRNGQGPLSPRRTQPGHSPGHSRVGMRRDGNIEGVRQSSGNWQTRGNQVETSPLAKRMVVKPSDPALMNSLLHRRLAHADNELAHLTRERKKRPMAELKWLEKIEEKMLSSKQQLSKCRQNVPSRLLRRNSGRNRLYEAEFENPELINLSSTENSDSNDVDGDMERDPWNNSSGDSDSESGEYSDWTADAGISLETLGKKSRSRPKRFPSEDEEQQEDKSEEREEKVDERIEEKRRTREERRVKRAKHNEIRELPEKFRPPEWLTSTVPQRVPFVPQVGDEVVYFRQGHEQYVEAVKRAKVYDIDVRRQAFQRFNLRDQELVKICRIKYEIRPPRLCLLYLAMIDPETGRLKGESFTVKFHDMPDVIDFLVLRQHYDQAMERNWKPGDRFRSIIDNAWWLGSIQLQEPLHPEFPDSMFQCFLVLWDNGESEKMSPWDFEPVDIRRMPSAKGGSVSILPGEREATMYLPTEDEWPPCRREAECARLLSGLETVMELAIAEPFLTPVDLNKYPVYAIVVEYPIDLSTIKARLENHYYRRIDALKFDIQFIEKNARKFNEPESQIVKQANIITEVLSRFISDLDCKNPMELYQELTEATQSRHMHTDSDTEVDITDSNSDGEQETAERRSKRRKKPSSKQPTKRFRLENEHYTSSSWKQQGRDFLDLICQCEDSMPFRHPVHLQEYPDYRDIIDIPMDLSTIRERLDAHCYMDPIDFCKDMRLMFQNSKNYNTNKKSRIYSMTIRMSAMFEEHIRGIISDWRSAVKYEEKVKNNQYVSNRRRPVPLAGTEWVPSPPSSSRSSNRPSQSSSNATVDTAPGTSGSKGNVLSPVQQVSGQRNRSDIKAEPGRGMSSSRPVTSTKTQKGSTLTRNVPKANGSAPKKKKKVQSVSDDEESCNENDKNKKRREKPNDRVGVAKSRVLKQQNLEARPPNKLVVAGSKKKCSKPITNGDMKKSRNIPNTRNRSLVLVPKPSEKRQTEAREKSRRRSPQRVVRTRRGDHGKPVTHMDSETEVSEPDDEMPVRHVRMLRSTGRHPVVQRSLRNGHGSARSSGRRRQATPDETGSENETSRSSRGRTTASSEATSRSGSSSSSQSSSSSSLSSSSTCAKKDSSSESEIAKRRSRSDSSTSGARERSPEENCAEEDEEEEEEQVPIRPATRSFTRTSAQSGITHVSVFPHTVVFRSSKMQTRNRGKQTVRYREESDYDYDVDSDTSMDSQVKEALSVSSRGRIRKLTRHAARALMME